MITTLLVYFTDSKHNVIRSHFFLNGHITIAIAGLSISGSILLPSSLMMPLFHAHSSSPTTLSVPVTANSHQFPAIYVCIEILDYMFHLLYPFTLPDLFHSSCAHCSIKKNFSYLIRQHYEMRKMLRNHLFTPEHLLLISYLIFWLKNFGLIFGCANLIFFLFSDL